MKRANAAAHAGLAARRRCRAKVIIFGNLLALAVERVEIVAQRNEEVLAPTTLTTREARVVVVERVRDDEMWPP